MDKIFEINKDGQNIKCRLYFNNNEPIEKVVLFGHGFEGNKDNETTKKFADRVLSKHKGIAVFIFNLPCHGDDIKKRIVLNDCLNYLKIVLDYIKTSLMTNEIYSYATSFGGYLVLKYISEYGNPFKKIALKCPAVNMAEVLTDTIMPGDEVERLLKGEIIPLVSDRMIEVDRQFLTDLKNTDVQRLDYTGFAKNIVIIHGTKDEIVPFEAGRKFAENNNIGFVPIEGADHQFKNPDLMEAATEKVLEFFAF